MQKLLTATIALLACATLAACPESAAPPATTEEPAADASATETPAFVGTWAADAASCAIPQEQQGAPHVFGPDNYNQHEAHCTYATVEETSPNTWHINAACSVEGDEQSSSWDLAVDGDTMTMDGTHRFVRCP
ncbi:MAG: hypothetical protein AB7H66_04600 [Hyphomonadaceae bacterium]